MVVQKQVYIKQGSTINRVRNESLITSIHKQYIGDSIRQKIDGKLTLEVGKPASLKLYCNESTYTAYSKEIVGIRPLFLKLWILRWMKRFFSRLKHLMIFAEKR